MLVSPSNANKAGSRSQEKRSLQKTVSIRRHTRIETLTCTIPSVAFAYSASLLRNRARAAPTGLSNRFRDHELRHSSFQCHVSYCCLHVCFVSFQFLPFFLVPHCKTCRRHGRGLFQGLYRYPVRYRTRTTGNLSEALQSCTTIICCRSVQRRSRYLER